MIGSTMWERSLRGTGKVASSIAQDFVKDNSLADRKVRENGKVFSKGRLQRPTKLQTTIHNSSNHSMELKPNKQKMKAWKI